MQRAENKELELLATKTLGICLSLFTAIGSEASTGDKESAQAYLDTLDVETLMEIIGQIFQEADENAPAPKTA